jgi:uncharacterized protein YndB with AHSA1/START domain
VALGDALTMLPTLIRRGLQLALVGAAAGWVIDRVLVAIEGDGPPPPIRSLIVIDAPIERVWAELADIEGQPRWMHEMKEVRLEPGPVGVGTRGIATVRIFGLSSRDPVRITAFEPPTRFAIEHLGTFRGGGEITLQAGADGSTTIVRWEETLIAPALPYAWSVLAEPIMTGIFQADLRRLRDLVEAGA